MQFKHPYKRDAKWLSVATFWFALLSTANVQATTDQGRGSESNLLEWQFRVYLDNRPIGTHDFRVSATDSHQRVETEAGFDVKVLFFNAYRYRHQNVELWNDNCLLGIDAKTNANGELFNVTGSAGERGFNVSTGDATDSLPACVMSFAYWNPAFLKADRLLNSQTGEYEDVDISSAGIEPVAINGSSIPAERFDIRLSKGTISVWYSVAEQRWLALDAPAKGGRRIRYEPTKLPVYKNLADRAIGNAS